MVEFEQQIATLNYIRTCVLYNVHIYIYLWGPDPRNCGEGRRGERESIGNGGSPGGSCNSSWVTVRGNKVRRGFHILGAQHLLSQRQRQSEREREKERERERERLIGVANMFLSPPYHSYTYIHIQHHLGLEKDVQSQR